MKERVTTAALGQVLAYRQLLMEDYPEAPDPRLIIVGRYSDPDTVRVLAAHGIDVFLYEPAPAE